MPIVIVWPPAMFFEINGERIEVLISQEMVDFARQLALNPQLVDRLDTESMTIEEETP